MNCQLLEISFIGGIFLILILLVYFFHYNNYQIIKKKENLSVEGFENLNNNNDNYNNQKENTQNNNNNIAFCFLTMGDINQLNIWKDFLKGHENKYNIYYDIYYYK